MIQLFDDDKKEFNNQSSKGNQIKWCRNNVWYKADYTGYESLAEYMVSHLLKYSSLSEDKYVLYYLEEVAYKRKVYNACRSYNFLPKGWQLVTLERLYKNVRGEDLSRVLGRIPDHSQRLKFLVEQIEKITGIREFGKYMSIMLTIDTLFLNEDRHLHNIAVLMDDAGHFSTCPIFDNGAALLADTTMDYPLGEDIIELIGEVRSKTGISEKMCEQIDIAEQLYGINIRFFFNEKIIAELLEKADQYSDVIKERVLNILLDQRRKYIYLFE